MLGAFLRLGLEFCELGARQQDAVGFLLEENRNGLERHAEFAHGNGLGRDGARIRRGAARRRQRGKAEDGKEEEDSRVPPWDCTLCSRKYARTAPVRARRRAGGPRPQLRGLAFRPGGTAIIALRPLRLFARVRATVLRDTVAGTGPRAFVLRPRPVPSWLRPVPGRGRLRPGTGRSHREQAPA